MSTILVIDDEPILRELFRRVLEHEGHTVLTAGNGRDALEMLRQRVPDLILLDLMMPQMDGISFLRLIRKHDAWKNIAVVVMSAMADRQHICNAGALGVRDYMLKAGFSCSQLRSRISKYLHPAPISVSGAPAGQETAVAGMMVE